MKMSYLQGKRYSRNKQNPFFSVFVIISVILAIFLYSSVLSGLSGTFSFLVYPLVKADGLLRSGLSDTVSFFHFQTTLVKENKALVETNNNLRLQLVSKNNLENENRELKVVLGLKAKDNKNLLAAVISRPDQLPYDILMLDIGSDNDKLAVGDKVLVAGGVILGSVAKIDSNITKVRLYSSYGEEIPVIVGKENIPAVASGRGGGNFLMILPRGLNIQVGDTVQTSIIGNYTLGTVGKIDKTVTDPFQKVYLKSPINLFNVKWVEIKSNNSK